MAVKTRLLVTTTRKSYYMHSNINKIGNDDAQLRMDKKYKTDI